MAFWHYRSTACAAQQLVAGAWGVLAAAVGNMASQCGILALQQCCWCRATAHGWRKECSLLQLWATWPHSMASWHCRSTAGAAQQLVAGACGVAVVLDSVGMATMQLAECRLAAVPWSRGSRRAILARAVRPALGSRRSDPRVRVGLITCRGVARSGEEEGGLER
ncbi:hypothetical protein PR003_g31772 [Phytophthora rubi]|uniref:Uncharacterized protein n=1 Tax=Phytophthora rubi TaxID=129364 RepID=A0A6A4B5S4_9STRA|nr:hypothetical protein PR003_g31772 [Phytophthora rubi]